MTDILPLPLWPMPDPDGVVFHLLMACRTAPVTGTHPVPSQSNEVKHA